MIAKLKISITIVFSLFFFACSSTMQILRGTGQLKGVVLDNDRSEPLIGASVVIRGTNLGAATGLDGQFLIKGIPSGEYEVSFNYVGYKQLTKKVRIYSSQTTVLNVRLVPQDEKPYKKNPDRVETPKNNMNEAKIEPSRMSNETSELFNPLDFLYVTSKFGEYRNYGRHSGVDFLANCNDPVYAIQSGRITFAGYKGGYGLMVEIKHNENFKSVYAHLSKLLVKDGELVRKGQVIGRAGDTGYATGCHLHFEIIINNRRVDPMKLLKKLK